MAPSETQDSVEQVRGAHSPGEALHGPVGEGTDLHQACRVPQLGKRFFPFVQPQRRHHEQPGSGRPPHEEVEQLQGRCPRVVEVVEEQQRRLPGAKGSEEPRHGLERPAPFDLRRRPLVGERSQDATDLRNEFGQRSIPFARKAANDIRRGVHHDRTDGVDERL
jgi:hypothetical protein